MPGLFNRMIDSYRVEVFESDGLGYNRHISLRLRATDGLPAHTVSIQFRPVRPTDFVDIGVGFSTIQMSASLYDQVYHVLQTESPVFLWAYEFGTLRFAGITTDEEAIGEGFRDAQALAAVLGNGALSLEESASSAGA